MDSLRYWVTEMHVDGFRFDLASALARSMHDVDRLSAFFDVVHQDPVVSNIKLIAEPWDVGPGGYQVGNFPRRGPSGTAVLGHRPRRVVRRARRRPGPRLPADRVLRPLRSDGRRPFASINFVTAARRLPDGRPRHLRAQAQQANGEDNRDGESHNRNWNCGVEGPTDDPEVQALRPAGAQPPRDAAVLHLRRRCSPAGDEQLHPAGQQQRLPPDNELSWIDWKSIDEDLCAFVTRPHGLRRSSPVLRQEAFFEGHEIPGAVAPATSCGSPSTAASCRPRTGSTPGCRRSACTSTGAGSGIATSTGVRWSTTPTSSSCTPVSIR